VRTAEFPAEPTQPAGPQVRHPPRRYPAESFTRAEVEAILAVCSGSVAGPNRALIIVLWRAGLRLGEALALRPRDVDAAGQF
jgi:integrase